MFLYSVTFAILKKLVVGFSFALVLGGCHTEAISPVAISPSYKATYHTRCVQKTGGLTRKQQMTSLKSTYQLS